MDGGYGIIRLSSATPMEVINALNAKKDSHLKKTIAPTVVQEWTVMICMTDQLKEVLNELSKDQLIYLIEQYYRSQFLIGEVCVDESKQHISSEQAIQEIRNYLYDMPNTYNVDNFKAQIDMGMGKITVDEYRKILGLD